MNSQKLIVEQVGLAVETFQLVVESLAELSAQAAAVMSETLLNDGKLVVCGMGVSGALAASFVARMQSRFERDRPALPAMLISGDGILTSAISHDLGPGDIYARQVRSLCQRPDVLVIFTASGNSAALIKTVQAAHDQGICVIAMTGQNGGDVAALLDTNDLELRVASHRPGNVQLAHHLLLNCLVELIENTLFGQDL